MVVQLSGVYINLLEVKGEPPLAAPPAYGLTSAEHAAAMKGSQVRA